MLRAANVDGLINPTLHVRASRCWRGSDNHPTHASRLEAPGGRASVPESQVRKPVDNRGGVASSHQGRIHVRSTASEPTFDPRRPFSRSEARAAGTRQTCCSRSAIQKLFWDCWVLRDVRVTPLLRAAAVLNLVPAGSHISPPHGGRALGCDRPRRRTHPRRLPSASGRQIRTGLRSHYGNAPVRPRCARACRSPPRAEHFSISPLPAQSVDWSWRPTG